MIECEWVEVDGKKKKSRQNFSIIRILCCKRRFLLEDLLFPEDSGVRPDSDSHSTPEPLTSFILIYGNANHAPHSFNFANHRVLSRGDTRTEPRTRTVGTHTDGQMSGVWRRRSFVFYLLTSSEVLQRNRSECKLDYYPRCILKGRSVHPPTINHHNIISV